MLLVGLRLAQAHARGADIHARSTRPDTLGFAGISGDRVNLAPDVCDSLVALAYNGARPADEVGQLLMGAAVVTLSTSLSTARASRTKRLPSATRSSLRTHTAARFGTSRAYAAALVRTYWRHYDKELAAYRSSECRDRGALDRGYAGSIWP